MRVFTVPIGMASSFSMSTVYYSFIAQTIVYTLLTIYFDKIFAPFGNSLSAFFIFSPSYWSDLYRRKFGNPLSNESTSQEIAERVGKEMNCNKYIDFDNFDVNSKPMVIFDNVSKTYNGSKKVKAVQGLNLVAFDNEVFAFLGHNGAGKSTSSKMLVGSVGATHGNIYVNGKDIDLKVREDKQVQKELKEQRRKNKELKTLKEEDEKRKQLENIKIKEWEEKFDQNQKEKELEENRRELRLKRKEFEKNKLLEQVPDDTKNLSLELERFDIDKNTKN